MQHDSQLTGEQRYQIYALLKKEYSKTEIAEIIGLYKATVSRELKRSSGGSGYRPNQAHRKAVQRREEKVHFGMREATWERVEQQLRKYWSHKQAIVFMTERVPGMTYLYKVQIKMRNPWQRVFVRKPNSSGAYQLNKPPCSNALQGMIPVNARPPEHVKLF